MLGVAVALMVGSSRRQCGRLLKLMGVRVKVTGDCRMCCSMRCVGVLPGLSVRMERVMCMHWSLVSTGDHAVVGVFLKCAMLARRVVLPVFLVNAAA